MSIERLVLGTAQLGLPYGIANATGLPSHDEAESVLDCAVDLGIAAVDTAPGYGLAEERLGRWLVRRRLSGQVAVTTKLPSIGDADAASLAGVVERAVEESRRRLCVETIDTYLLHDAGDLERHGAALADALVRQRVLGRVRRIGVSAYDPDEALRCLAFPELSVTQHPMNLFDGRLANTGALASLADAGVAVQARSIFLQGLFALDPERLPTSVRHAAAPLRTLRRLCAEWGMEPMEAALPFVLSQQVPYVVLGADSAEQLRRSVGSASRKLPSGAADALGRELDDVSEAVRDPRRWTDIASRA